MGVTLKVNSLRGDPPKQYQKGKMPEFLCNENVATATVSLWVGRPEKRNPRVV